PYVLAEVDRRYFGSTEQVLTRAEIVTRLMPYIEAQMRKGVRMHQITRHILGLYHGQPRARAWRRHLSEVGVLADSGIDVLRDALAIVERAETFVAA
ncbi:MAG: tRNA-dihydrouridine synthase, partial [Fimbriimonadaceae bacterium]|nr:tRNA-dihydrouridine synthase [Alphaproteobacteria bacterium]